MIPVTKIEAASRQLDTAIQLFFSGGDSISIHTLATGAENIFADISDHTLGHSWRSRTGDEHRLSETQLRATFHREWNFFKHADHDPEGTLEFDESITDHMIFVASLECATVQKKLSPITQVYQVWYIAAYAHNFPKTEPLFATAQQALPNLQHVERSEQIRRGAEFLAEKLRLFTAHR